VNFIEKSFLCNLVSSPLSGDDLYNKQSIISNVDKVLFYQLADEFIDVTPVSVTDKVDGEFPKHDYVSHRKYWWLSSDAEKTYVRRDGEVNPICYSPEYDYMRLMRMSETVSILSVAAMLSGDSKYSDKALTWLRTWFLDPKTLQSPNFKYAQIIPGKGQGGFTGVIESRYFIYVIEAINILYSENLIPSEDIEKLKAWFADFLYSITHSSQGKEASKRSNNIALWFDLQCIVIADFIGDKKSVELLLKEITPKRVEAQVDKDGGIPNEISRKHSNHYVAFTLLSIVKVSAMGKKYGVPFWTEKPIDGAGYEAVYDWISALPASKAQREMMGRQLLSSADENLNIDSSMENNEALSEVMLHRKISAIREKMIVEKNEVISKLEQEILLLKELTAS
jgi:hypothetical protein